jgi:hypothetical protein
MEVSNPLVSSFIFANPYWRKVSSREERLSREEEEVALK